FVKVGANDGFTGDPCSDILLQKDNWKGLLIEPVPFCFERLQHRFGDQRRFILKQLAVGPVSKGKQFYYVEKRAKFEIPSLPEWFDQLGSFNREHIEKELNGILKPYIVECAVEVVPLSKILELTGIGQPQLLHIDTEGFDYEVIKTLDF